MESVLLIGCAFAYKGISPATSIDALTAISMVATPHWGDSSLSIDLTSDEISATGGHLRFALERFALLVSVDSFRSFLPLANATLWHRFLRSPRLANAWSE